MKQFSKHPIIFTVLLFLLLIYPAIVGTTSSQIRRIEIYGKIKPLPHVNKADSLLNCIKSTDAVIKKQQDTIKQQQIILKNQTKPLYVKQQN